jgi:uncharacterized damage-inducible protein DinB
MDPIRYYRRLLAYDAWANRETIINLRALDEPPPRAVQLVGHIVGAEWLWYTRVRREEPRMAVWPDLAPADCERAFEDVAEAWRRFFQSRTPDGLRDSVEYVNTKGESWRSSVEDILQHLVIHSSYHRAQVAHELRQAGGMPVNTDFIHAVRAGFVSQLAPRGRRR